MFRPSVRPSVCLSGRLVTVSLLLCTVQLFQLDCPLNLVLNKDKRYSSSSSSSSSTVQFKGKENIRNWNGKNEPTEKRKKERKGTTENKKSLSAFIYPKSTLSFGPCPNSFHWMLLYCTTHTVRCTAGDCYSHRRRVYVQINCVTKKNRSRAVGNGLYVRCAASQRQ